MSGKLKDFDFKAFVVDHGEKVVMGVVGLLIVLAIYDANWATYQEKTPEEITEKVQTTGRQIQSSTWPEEKAREYPTTARIDSSAARLMSPESIEVARYQYGTEYFIPLYKPDEPITIPNVKNVESLIADAGSVIVTTIPVSTDAKDASDAKSEEKESEKTEKSDDGSPFAPATSRAPRGGNGFDSAAEAGIGALEGFGAGRYSGGGMDAEGMMEMDGQGSSGAVGPKIEGRGFRFVSVRGVYPWREQIENIARAFHQTYVSVQNKLQIVDFEIQRQKAVAGQDPWSGEWMTLDLDVPLSVLEQVSDFDEDVVQTNVTDPVITMPLPRRVRSSWTFDDIATHERIKSYVLSDEGRARQRLLNAQLSKREEELEKLNKNRVKELEMGGFGTVQKNMRKMRQNLSGYGDSGMMDEMINDMQDQAKEMQGMSSSGGYGGSFGNTAQMTAELQKTVSAAGNLLLFRYLDFDVEPGTVYRYRVKIAIANPTRAGEVDPARLANPESASQEVLWTNWGEPTKPVLVPQDAHYFLTEVDPATTRRPDTARFNVYQWYSDSGTVINETLDTIRGQFIGGKKKTKVLRPAPQTFDEEEDVQFETNDALVDVDNAVRLDPDLHADLGESALDRQGHTTVADVALVVDKHGVLDTFDPLSEESSEEKWEDYKTRERDAYSFIEERKKKVDALDQFTGDGMESGMDSMMETYGGGVGGPSPIRKKRGRGRSKAGRGRAGGGSDSGGSSSSVP